MSQRQRKLEQKSVVTLRGIPVLAEEAKVIEWLQNDYGAMGATVASPTSKLRGMAFVDFATPDQAQHAAAILHGTYFEGSRIKASMKKDKCSSKRKALTSPETSSSPTEVTQSSIKRQRSQSHRRPQGWKLVAASRVCQASVASYQTPTHSSRGIDHLATNQHPGIKNGNSHRISTTSKCIANVVASHPLVYSKILGVLRDAGLYGPFPPSRNGHGEDATSAPMTNGELQKRDISLEEIAQQWTGSAHLELDQWKCWVNQGKIKPWFGRQLMEEGTVLPEDPKIRQLFADHQPGPPNNCLYLKNLPIPRTSGRRSKQETKEKREKVLNFYLLRLFGGFVSPQHHTTPRSIVLCVKAFVAGKMRGQAFISYKTTLEAHIALRALQGYYVSIDPTEEGPCIRPRSSPVLIGFKQIIP
eukprot:gb/GECG01004342.1/.p1 GENE.gb/GECG01004342.1/~~gb/GECG01004342.1/.p1  ORF type:complete len:415 (+),score=33.54 gb/GECG01004342.1/:1-1245(+)